MRSRKFAKTLQTHVGSFKSLQIPLQLRPCSGQQQPVQSVSERLKFLGAIRRQERPITVKCSARTWKYQYCGSCNRVL